MNVLNEEYLRTLTLKRMLLKMVVLGAFGAKDFEYHGWYIAGIAFTFCLRSFKVAQYPGFLRLTNLEIHADRVFGFLIC